MTLNPKYRPVLILGTSARISIPMARSLRSRGIPVEVASFQPQEPVIKTRAVQRFHKLPEWKRGSSEFAAALIALIKERGFDTLFSAGDPALAAIAENYDELNKLLYLGCPSARAAESVLNKPLTLKAAEECGIQVPFTSTVSTSQELEAIGSRLRFPVVAKPGKKGAASFRVLYFYTLPDLAAAISSNDWGAVLLQEYCPGVGVGVEILMSGGACVAAFQHRRLKESPPTGGVAVMAVAEALDPSLLDASQKLLRALEWEGVAMVEFKKDLNTGNTVLMEVNGRYWGSSSFPTLAGIDFAYYHWQLARGEKPTVPQQYAVGTTWRWTAGYFERLHAILANTGTKIGPSHRRLAALAEIPRDFSPKVVDALWSWAEPGPAIFELWHTVKQFMRADFKWLLRKFIPKRLMRERNICARLGPKAGPIYAKLRLLDAIGIRGSNKLKVSPKARSFVFICHGNIMRSPMSEALMRHALSERGRRDFKVSSAGMHATTGKIAHPCGQLVASEMGISLRDHRAQLLTKQMVEESDAIFAMDFMNKAELLALYPEAKNKIVMLSAYADSPLRYREIPDPFFGNEDVTRVCYGVLKLCIGNLMESLFPISSEISNADAPASFRVSASELKDQVRPDPVHYSKSKNAE